MLVYNLLGSDAQNSFATSWGISYAMDAATEWCLLACLPASHACAALTPSPRCCAGKTLLSRR